MAKDTLSESGLELSGPEIWMPIPSEPGCLASSWGRVLLAPSFSAMANGGYRLHTPQPRFGNVAKPCQTASHEYMHVMVKRIKEGGRQSPRKVHQLVCEAFHGPKPFPAAVVLHLDEDGLNNRPENLKWGTQRENMNSPKYKEWARSRTGDASPRAIWAARQKEALF